VRETTRDPVVAVVCADAAQADWLADSLERDGLFVRTWASAEMALQALREIRPPRLIIADLQLPDIDGWRFCRLLRSPEYGSLRQTPLLVVSDAFRGADADELAGELGAEAFLELPCPVDSLRETVKRLLSGGVQPRVTSVLVVDDDATQCTSLKIRFEQLGFSTRTAQTAAEARALIQEHPPDLAIIDHYLPDDHGDHLLAELKERNPQTVVVMFTGRPSPELAVELMRLGADGYVAKPFEFDYLYNVCETARRRRHLQRAEALLNERTRELRESEAYYRSLIENTSDVITIVEPDGTFRYVSPSVKRLLGYKPDQLLGTNGFALVAEEDRERLRAALRAVRARESGRPVEFRMRTAEGGWRTVEGDARNRLEDPAVGGILVTIHDLTERKEAEAARRRFLERLTALHEVTNELSGAATLEDLCRQAVTLGRERLGFQQLGVWLATEDTGQSGRFPRLDEPGRFHTELPAVAPPAGCPLARVLNGETEADLRQEAPLVIDPDAERRPGYQAAVALRKDGELIGALVAEASPGHEPLTEQDLEVLRLFASTVSHLYTRKLAEQALAAKSELLTATLLSMGEAVFVADGEGRLVMLNSAAEELTGWSQAVCAEKTLTDLAPRLGLPATPNPLLLPADGTLRELETETTPRRVLEVRLTAIREGVQSGGRVILLREVTEDRQVRQQLEQQGRLAAVGQLAAGIAHDFNNLLTGVLGFAELLQRRDDIPASAKNRLRAIEEQGQRAAELIRQILDFSRRSTVQLRPLNLTSLLKETVKLLERTIEERVHLRLEIEPVRHMVNADVAQFQQVLTNLAVNARDAMPAGGELRIRMARQTFTPEEPRPFPNMPDGDYVVLFVSDTGSGMSPEVQEHIFEPFFTTKERGKGTGLGLAQVYGIVKQHNGYIGVESEVGKGTTFTLYLPAIGTEEELHEKTPEPVAHGNKQTLLVVEDEPKVREVLTAMLTALNYRVLTAENGREALELYRQRGDEVELVLTDMTMPEMGGVELFQALRRLNPEVKVIVVSGYPQGEDTDDLLEQGLTGWIQKPPSLAVLSEAVGAALKESAPLDPDRQS